MDLTQLTQAALSLLFVLGLLLGVAWLAQRSGLVARVTPAAAGQKTLQVVEILPLDMRHKVIRLRDDSTHYLIVIGGETPVVLGATPHHEVAV